MDFGSKYIYKYAHSEEESVSDEDNELGNDAEQLFVPKSAACADAKEHRIVSTVSEQSAASHRKKRLRKPDTNVLSVKFNRLLQPGEMHAGDAVYCSECGAIASHLSKIQSEESENSKWQCEFCPNLNTVDIEQNDLPKQEDATYLVAPAPVVHGSDMTGVDNSIVFFLIDVSGSMSSTTLVQGAFNLPNALKQQERAAEAFGGAHITRQRNQTYVSRLQGVQMAVDANLDKLVKETPTRRAALLTFNHEITYYGDGTRDEPLVIRGDKLNNPDDLLNEAEREANKELKSVAQTKTKLTERVYDLEEGGQTALGPAVVFALNIASKRQGSKIVICTDGLANRGLGSLELAQDEKVEEAIKMQALHEGNQFYSDLTEKARENGISISVITIKGTACLLPVIGQMADGTGGNVTIVDLLNMRDEFASILEQKVIATNVEATLIVHRGLYIRNPDDTEEKLEKIKKVIGNVTKQTEVTFEFGVRNKQEIREKYHIEFDELKQLPFQVQVTYTAVDGSKALRVLTQLKETTDIREVAEVNAVRSVIAENHIRSTANDMMATVSDEDEEYTTTRVRSKWSTPTVQKQRLAYMDNLTSKVRSRGTYETDQFNERRWNKASNDLQSHVITSRSRKAVQSRTTTLALSGPPESPSSGGSILSTIGDRVSRLFTGSSKEKSPASEHFATPKAHAKRSYGFATSNLGNFSDQHSEDLYRYKNISSDYMRESSPPRNDDDRSATASSRPVVRQNSNEDRAATIPNTRRPIVRIQNDDDKSADLTSSGGFSVREISEKNDTPAAPQLPTERRPKKDKSSSDDDREMGDDERL